jgi:hypothetical protein
LYQVGQAGLPQAKCSSFPVAANPVLVYNLIVWQSAIVASPAEG